MKKEILFLFCCIVCVSFGCSNAIRTEPVTGTVYLNGTPLEGATVNFSPKDSADGLPSFGKTDASGKYKLQTLQGAPDAGTTPGEYLVSISKTEMVNTGKFYPGTPQNPQGSEILESVLRTPKKYSDTSTSGFTATVKKGKNVFDFELESD